MGTTCFKCLFRTGYCLYARTCLGRRMHNLMLNSFHKQYGKKAAHTLITPFVFGTGLLVVPMPYLLNNYCYVVADISKGNFIYIDVGDGELMKTVGCPDAILTTHKHWDHSGGNRTMRKAHPKLKVFGGEKDRVPDHTDTVADGQVLTFGRLRLTAIWTPGHTKGHIVWRLHGEAFDTMDSLFTGDHLMLGCCGAHFEGSVEQMVKSLDLMQQFPDDTWVWPGHEAALSAMQTAIFVDPCNLFALAKLAWVLERRGSQRCTCPSTIGEEKRYNPFMRTDDEVLQVVLGMRKNILPIDAKDRMKRQVACFQRIMAKSSKFPADCAFIDDPQPNEFLDHVTMADVLPMAKSVHLKRQEGPVEDSQEADLDQQPDWICTLVRCNPHKNQRHICTHDNVWAGPARGLTCHTPPRGHGSKLALAKVESNTERRLSIGEKKRKKIKN